MLSGDVLQCQDCVSGRGPKNFSQVLLQLNKTGWSVAGEGLKSFARQTPRSDYGL